MEFKHRDDEIIDKPIERMVFIAAEQYKELACGPVYGKYFKDTGVYNIFPDTLKEDGEYLGEVIDNTDIIPENKFVGIKRENTIDFYYDRKLLQVELHYLYLDIFSRNKGILETGIMQDKGAVILGCGSVGSLVAMELAKSGIGSLFLIDPDMMEYHNICRHQCGIDDVGDLKVNALKRKLLRINPSIRVRCSSTIVENTSQRELEEFCRNNKVNVFVGCADNRIADVYGNQISIYFKSPYISIGFWERAFAGEIFYHIPNKNMPCYYCALGDGGDISARSIANHHVYSMEENVESIKFEPGISVDIDFITAIGIKLIIDLLNFNESGYIPRLLNDLKQYTIICNTNNPEIAGEMVEIFSYPLQISTSLEVQFNPCCKGICKYELEQMENK